MNAVCASLPPPAPPPAALAAPPSSGETQRAKSFMNSACRVIPKSPQVRGVIVLPRRTTSGPMADSTYFDIAPSGPNIGAISVGDASMLDLAANGYLIANLRLNGSNTCASQVLFSSSEAGLTIAA